MWHVKLLRISSGLWICQSRSILLRLDFCRVCKMTAGCDFHNQLLFTACCLMTVGWIKANRVSSLPILFCPLTVNIKRGWIMIYEESNSMIKIDYLDSFFGILAVQNIKQRIFCCTQLLIVLVQCFFKYSLNGPTTSEIRCPQNIVLFDLYPKDE